MQPRPGVSAQAFAFSRAVRLCCSIGGGKAPLCLPAALHQDRAVEAPRQRIHHAYMGSLDAEERGEYAGATHGERQWYRSSQGSKQAWEQNRGNTSSIPVRNQSQAPAPS